MNYPWTWTTEWGLAVGAVRGLGGGVQRGEIYTTNRKTVKN